MNRQAELICVSKCVHTYKDALFSARLQSVIILPDGLCNNKAQLFLPSTLFISSVFLSKMLSTLCFSKQRLIYIVVDDFTGTQEVFCVQV